MIRKNWISKTEKTFKFVQIVGTFLILFIAASLKADSSTVWSGLKDPLDFSQRWAFVFIPILTIVVGFANFFKTHFGNQNTWNTVTLLLEEYKNAVFVNDESLQEDPDFFHRVTLYKFVRWRWAICKFPWTGWMIPVARTGHTTHSHKIPRFKAPKASPDKAEGVAGRTFVYRKMLSIFGLPEIKSDPTDNDIEVYSSKGFVSKKWIQARETCYSRSLVGIPIEVKNQPWGVLVIDSRSPNEISTKEILTATEFTRLAKVLGKLMEN